MTTMVDTLLTARQVGLALDPLLDGWTLEPEAAEEDRRNPNYARMVRADGAAFALTMQTWGAGKGRCTVHGVWPRVGGTTISPGTGQVIEMTFDSARVGKNPANVVADIKRRFLPTFLETWAELKQRADDLVASRAFLADAAKRVASMFGPSASVRAGNDGDTYAVYPDPDEDGGFAVVGTIHLHAGHEASEPTLSARFEVRCGEDTLRAISEALAKRPRPWQ